MLRKVLSKKKKNSLSDIFYFDEKIHNDINSKKTELDVKKNKTLAFFNQVSNLYQNAQSIVKRRTQIEESNLIIKNLNEKLNTFFDINLIRKNSITVGAFALSSAILSFFIFFTSTAFYIFKADIEQSQGSYEDYNLKLLNEHLKYHLITQEPISYIQYLEGKHYESSKILTTDEKNETVIHNIIEAEKYKQLKKILVNFFFFTFFTFIYLFFHFGVFCRLINKDEWEKELSLEKEKNTTNQNLLELELSSYQMEFVKLKPNKDTIYLQDEFLNFYTEQYEKHSKLNKSQYHILQTLILKRIPPFVFDYQACSFVFNDQSNLIEDYQKLNADLKAIYTSF